MIMSNHYIIERAIGADLNALLALNACANPHPWREAHVKDALDNRHNWVIRDTQTDDLVAWLTASKVFDQTELELVLTHPDKRRLGLAERLVSQWLHWARTQSCVEALLEVRASNLSAIGLYQKLAFDQVGLRKNYYPLAEGGKEAAVLMTRPLSGSTHTDNGA